MKVKNDPRSEFSNFKQLERRSLKKIRASTGFEPVTSFFFFFFFFQASSFQLLKLENLSNWKICQLGGLEIAFCIPSARGIHFLVSPAFVSKVSLDFTRRVKLSAFSSSLACHI